MLREEAGCSRRSAGYRHVILSQLAKIVSADPNVWVSVLKGGVISDQWGVAIPWAELPGRTQAFGYDGSSPSGREVMES